MEHGIICTICVNPKEYFELYGILYEMNKKQNGAKKGTKDMDFDNYASRILKLEDTEKGTNRFAQEKQQVRLQNNKGNMVMETIERSKSGQLSDKRYANGISSLPYEHKDLGYLENFKSEISLTAEKLVKFHKNNLLRFEQGILQSNEMIRAINSVLLQRPIFYRRTTLKRS